MDQEKGDLLEALRTAENQEQRDAVRRQLPRGSLEDQSDRVSAEIESANSEMMRHVASMQEQAQGRRGGGMSKAAWEDEEQGVERALGTLSTLNPKP